MTQQIPRRFNVRPKLPEKSSERMTEGMPTDDLAEFIVAHEPPQCAMERAIVWAT